MSELRAASLKLREDTFVTTVCFFFSRKNTNKHIQTYRSSSLSSVENTPSGKCSMAFEDKSLKQINQYWQLFLVMFIIKIMIMMMMMFNGI